MKDIFTSFDDENENNKIKSERISLDDNSPDDKIQYDDISDNRTFTFEDIDSGRDITDIPSAQTGEAENFYNFDDFSGFSDRYSEQTSNQTDDNVYLPHESTADEFVKDRTKKHVGHAKKNNDRPGTKKLVISAVICVILILVLGVFAYAYNLCGKADYQPDTHKENEFISESELFSDKRITNILVIGTDKLESDSTFRSDSMILVSLDKKTHKLKLTSFLRDSYVYIPAKGYSTKLNAACSYGGPQMVIDTIEYNFKVHIDKYVMIDFDIFKTIISDLGGIKLTITKEEAACIERESGLKCKSGTHTYRARLALWYARIRHLDSDFKRTERQRKVIKAVIDKMKKSNIITLNKMFNNALVQIQTDLSASELFSLGLKALPFLKSDIEEMQIPADNTWKNAYVSGQAVLKLDFDKNTELLKEFIYGTK